MVFSKNAQKFTKAVCSFVVPAISGNDGSGAALWCGIDGDGDNSLLQAGIAMTMNNGAAQYSAWTEWFPNPSQTVDGFTVNQGDQITVTIEATSSTQGTVTVDNNTSGQSTGPTTLTAPTQNGAVQPLAGITAEIILEDFSVNGSDIPFVDFDPVTFTNSHVFVSDDFGDEANMKEVDFSTGTPWVIAKGDATLTSVQTQGSNSFTVTRIGT